MQVYNVVNGLKFVLPAERKDEADMMVDVLDKQNAGLGPGFTLLGVVVRPSMVWTLAGGMASVIAGATISVLIDMNPETTLHVSTGSLDA